MRRRGKAPDMHVGCAGWAIPSQAAASFPGSGSHLERYSRVFSCVEINSSFYRAHQPKTWHRWADSVPDAFRFSVKMPRSITHDARLHGTDALLGAFLDQITGLGEKLGCILVQLPPGLALEARTAKAFFAGVRRRTAAPVACEPRHASWFTAHGQALMQAAGVACVRADPAPAPGAACTDDPALLYIRLHGAPQIYYSAYDDAFLAETARRMRQAAEKGKEVWCIFDNTARGAAIPNALTLWRAVDAP